MTEKQMLAMAEAARNLAATTKGAPYVQMIFNQKNVGCYFAQRMRYSSSKGAKGAISWDVDGKRVAAADLLKTVNG